MPSGTAHIPRWVPRHIAGIWKPSCRDLPSGRGIPVHRHHDAADGNSVDINKADSEGLPPLNGNTRLSSIVQTIPSRSDRTSTAIYSRIPRVVHAFPLMYGYSHYVQIEHQRQCTHEYPGQCTPLFSKVRIFPLRAGHAEGTKTANRTAGRVSLRVCR